MKKKMQAFNVLNATERPWKTSQRVFNVLRVLFLKRCIFVHVYPQSQSLQADIHTLAPFYA